MVRKGGVHAWARACVRVCESEVILKRMLCVGRHVRDRLVVVMYRKTCERQDGWWLCIGRHVRDRMVVVMYRETCERQDGGGYV